MCLAIPMQLIKVEGVLGIVELDGIRREVGLDLIDQAQVGDYLIIHAGYAIEKLDEAEAEKTLRLFRELNSGTEE